MSRRCGLLLAVALLAAAPGGAAAQGYESPPDVYIGNVLDPSLLQSGNHRVLDEVKTDGRTLEFAIESDYGSYRVRSVPMVVLRVREIRTLAQAINQFDRDNTRLATSLRGQLQVGGDSIVQILTSPFQSASTLAGQLANNVGDTFKELNDFSGPEPQATGTGAGAPGYYQRFEPGDPVLASYRRSIASQLDLDVYSTNPRVQEFLNTVAAARAGGLRSAGTISVTLPRDPEAKVEGGRVQTRVRNTLAHQTVREVYQQNLQRLTAMGIDATLAHKFLRHPPISPFHATAITEYLGVLPRVENRGALLEAAVYSVDEQGAVSYVQSGRMIGVLHEREGPVTVMLSSGQIPVVVTQPGVLVVVVPYDVIYWDEQTDRIFTAIAKLATERRYTGLELVASGVLTDLASEQLEKRGFKVRPRFLYEK